MTSSRTRRSLIALYPARWRRRYGDEVLGHLDDEWGTTRLPVRTVLDLAVAAAVERSRGAFDVAASPTDLDATRGLRLLAWGWCCCMVGGIGFAKLAEHFWTARFRPLGVPSGFAVAAASYAAVQWVAAMGAVCLSLLVAPAVLVALAHGGRVARRRLGGALALAVVLSCLAAGYLVWIVLWAHGLTLAQRVGGSPGYDTSVVGLAVLVTAALAAWTRVASAALRGVVPAHGARSVALVARLLSLCVVGVTLAAGLWLAAVAVDARGFLIPVLGPHAAALTSQWPYVLAPEVLLVAGAVLAVRGAWLVTAPSGGADKVGVTA
ncbi:MAG TPA: hypothetical protein VGZ03_08365 [Acidimicrobiales bacterium]|jgi:predicted membrane protein|nr:hypothetical protein [Acidimicrobiales bacterium]